MAKDIFSFMNKNIAKGDYPLMFGESPLDRMDEKRKDYQWLMSEIAHPISRFVVISNEQALMTVKPNFAVCYLTFGAVHQLMNEGAPWVFLGHDGERSYFAIGLIESQSEDVMATEFEKFIDLRSIAHSASFNEKGKVSDIKTGETAILAGAKSILKWHLSHRYCAKCGTETAMQNGGFMRQCPSDACGAQHFPRTDPVVIMLAFKGDKCLLGRGPTWPERRFSALAGFMEPGETIEEAVRRELWEEAGIRGGEVRYFSSQPWPFPSTLMIGCFVEALNDEIEIRDGELEVAQWVSKIDILTAFKVDESDEKEASKAPLLLPPPLAIAHHLIANWAK